MPRLAGTANRSPGDGPGCFRITADQWEALPLEERRARVRGLTIEVIRPESNLGGIPGVIGPELTDDERWSLIEWLKTL